MMGMAQGYPCTSHEKSCALLQDTAVREVLGMTVSNSDALLNRFR